MATSTAKPKPELVEKFKTLVAKPIDLQVEHFLKTFIFALDDKWKDIPNLAKTFTEACENQQVMGDMGAAAQSDKPAEERTALTQIQAADFLQKHGIARTAIERKNELKDIDLDDNGEIAFTEFLLLTYKIMILKEYYKRTGETPAEDLSGSGVGVLGVGQKLLDQLFTLPAGLDAALEKAIEEFTQKKREREAKLKELTAKAAAGGVKGLAAANEIEQLKSADQTEMNRIELTLNAAKKKAAKSGGDQALAAKKKAEEDEHKKKQEESRNKMKALASKFDQPAAAETSTPPKRGSTVKTPTSGTDTPPRRGSGVKTTPAPAPHPAPPETPPPKD